MRKNVSSDDSGYEFFKVYLPESSSQKMLIPPAFTSYFNGSMPCGAVLKDHRGRPWNVRLEEKGNCGILITKGWKEFVRHHSLEFGDFLIFNYDGESNFLVKVFAKNGCRKDLDSGNNACNRSAKEEEMSDSECARGRDTFSGKKKNEETIPRGVQESDGPLEATVRRFEKVCAKRARNCEAFGGDSNVVPKNSHEAKVRKSEKVCAKNARNSEAFGEDSYIVPKNPHFVKRIRPGFRYQIPLPRTFVDQYGIKLNSEVMLCDENGKRWPVKVNFMDSRRIYLSSGWCRFRRSQKMPETCKCLFEFFLDERSRCEEILVKVLRGNVATEKQDRCEVIVVNE